ncbi:1,4-alpha-glucan branching enzyme [Pararhodobacter marinus]|uniref:1,4-alpha-glucan branching enzyme GlgB n=1 Tax=Pararhodobacter marinus TaxID=2184063 RepID=A0A2U2CFQ3_9RHOB|nr:1,4-alpha-glucan branching protein GlgB [Pararhodobacter marinus]PWE30716.1 1,4-alpha-glucan branching enzyme [Pararhodobacter marinus]
MARAKSNTSRDISDADISAISEGVVRDPFDVFGPRHRGRPGVLVAFDSYARSMEAVTPTGVITLQPKGNGVFCGDLGRRRTYRLRASDGERSWEYEDPFRFGPVLGDLDLHLIGEGTHRRLWEALGAHPITHEGVEGVHFAVWAPAARGVSVVGAFNGWDGRRAPMRHRGHGIYEIFLPGLQPGEAYKYQIRPQDGAPFLKADPLARATECPPATASRIPPARTRDWGDERWMQTRAQANSREAPISIYEVNLASWRHRDGRALSYREAAEELVDYAHDMGFTHIEFMPLAEYPFGGSWGYQPTGLYAATSRFGSADDFRALVEAAHDKGLGVLMDWVPAHFPNDAHGLAYFDGSALYEHADPREGFHPDWNTHIYNYGRTEVRNFLSANAVYWLREFHLDGLRVDAVASMLYRDYSRAHDAWIPNRDGGRENYEAIDFLREMNTLAYGEGPAGAMTVAEESTAWPGVTVPVHHGGLGFGFKWNMGWMNDTLRYIEKDPIHRRHHHELMTFGLVYAFSENYVLPISHDEVVHGKGSMLQKMPGDHAAKLANLRAYYGFMWGHPGKKLLFMGCEFAQGHEWNHDHALDWGVLDVPGHAGLQTLVRDLNTLYRGTPALYQRDADAEAFRWIDRDAAAESVFSWLRLGHEGTPPVVVVCNFTPVERNWTLGLPQAGAWREALNTDAARYGGGNHGNLGRVTADGPPRSGQPHSATLVLPPLSVLYLIPEENP